MFHRQPGRQKVYVEANEYAKDIVKGRWPEFEEAILNREVASPGWMACIYAREVLKGPWPEAEDIIVEDCMAACSYAEQVLNAPWPKGEPAIAKFWGAAEYAIHVRKARFPEAEEELRKHPDHWEMYCKHFGLDPASKADEEPDEEPDEAPDWFRTTLGFMHEDVDLNDPKTYEHCHYRNWDCFTLREEIYRKVGYTKLYVEQFHPDWDKRQVARIDQMLFWFGREHRKYYGDTPRGRAWLRKWLFMFEDETENMC